MHPWRWLLPVLLLSLLVPAQAADVTRSAPRPPSIAALDDVTALRWVPRRGRLFVQNGDSGAWYVFDHQLRHVNSLAEAPDWNSLPAPQECVAEGKNQALEVQGPGGRTIRWQVDRGELLLCVAAWEQAGDIQWGPGWATLEFRCSQPLGPWLQWRDSNGIQHLSAVEIDPYDPLRQRAFLTGLAAEGSIQIRHRPVERSFPSRKWCDWIDLPIAQVDPSGPRPTSMLHSTICGLRRAKSPR